MAERPKRPKRPLAKTPAKDRVAPRDAYHHRDLRRALVDEAVAVLREAGTDDFTLRSLARRLGVSHAAPYAHFADKTALLAEIAVLGFTSLRESMSLEAASHADAPDEAMVAIGVAYVRFGLQHPAHYRLMFVAPELCGANKPDVVEASGHACFQVLIDALDALRTDASERFGEHRVDALGAWSMVHGLTLLLIDQRAKYQMEPAAALVLTDRALRLFLHGLLPV